jgi:hypothetical protein
VIAALHAQLSPTLGDYLSSLRRWYTRPLPATKVVQWLMNTQIPPRTFAAYAISAFEDFLQCWDCRRCPPAFGMISRQHLKGIRQTSGDNVSPAFMFVNHSLHVVTRFPRLDCHELFSSFCRCHTMAFHLKPRNRTCSFLDSPNNSSLSRLSLAFLVERECTIRLRIARIGPLQFLTVPDRSQ